MWTDGKNGLYTNWPLFWCTKCVDWQQEWTCLLTDLCFIKTGIKLLSLFWFISRVDYQWEQAYQFLGLCFGASAMWKDGKNGLVYSSAFVLVHHLCGLMTGMDLFTYLPLLWWICWFTQLDIKCTAGLNFESIVSLRQQQRTQESFLSGANHDLKSRTWEFQWNWLHWQTWQWHTFIISRC